MATITTKDGTTIYYKDWGTGQPIVFSHGWPLTGDDWDSQMLFFGSKDIVSLRTIGAAMDVLRKLGMATTWIRTPTIWRI